MNPDLLEIEDVVPRGLLRNRLMEPAQRTLAAKRGSPLDAYRSRAESRDDVDFCVLARLREIEPRKGPPPWAIGFSKQFKKDTSALDRKLMGRLLEVLEELSDLEPPFKARGDTFKPLTGELTGCWRYRIGDSRLILQPLVEAGQINALAFAARGNVYH